MSEQLCIVSHMMFDGIVNGSEDGSKTGSLRQIYKYETM